MKFLLEHEVGFSTEKLAFPSIQGCIAIVYQTANGLYGYHSYGGSAADKWQGRAQRFSEFVQANGGTAGGTRLYGISFVGNNQRGYSGVARTSWINELRTYAAELNYAGKISGYDLNKSFPGGGKSAYVEFRRHGPKCDVYVREWTHAEMRSASERTLNRFPLTHRVILTRGARDLFLENLHTVATNVNRNGVTKISKEKLR